jgi:membrane protein YdbS with pleckstrin-like domain
MIPDGFERLDPRIIDVRQTAGLITAAVLAALALIGLGSLGLATRPSWMVLGLGAAGWLAASLLLAWWLWRWPTISYRYASYRLDESGIEIRRGVVWRSIINVPRSRVQHTDVSQGPLERSHALSTLIIHTAGTAHARVALPGLARPVAIRLRDQLLPHDGRDAV